MKNAYQHLFSKGKIGSLELKNRILKSPQSSGLSHMDGTVSERLIRHYKELARGGAGLIMVEYTYIDNEASKSAFCQLGISSDEHIAGLSWLVSTIKDHGAKAGLQIEHCGRQKFLGTPPIKAPSRIPWPTMYEQTGYVPEELTIEEIKQIVNDFGNAALRAKKAGFDIVEIHGGHGYLITNFLSPHTNKRNDLYGGSLENRMRILIEIIKNVRSKVGPDFPLSVRISGSDYEPDGITIEDSIQISKAAEKQGVDAIHVSGGDHHMMVYQVSPMTIPSAPNVWAAEAIKKEVSIPVLASGSINNPELAEDILRTKKGDFISMGRPLFADPEFPLKAQEGRPEDIRPCIRCNDGCLERTFFNFRSIRCTVNPNMGREGDNPITPADTIKKIAIVGGGPAGLEAARVSALRGHEVTIYEKNALGGSLIPASASKFKTDISGLTQYYVTQMEKLKVKIIHQEADVETLQKGDYDAVIVAAGKVPNALQLPGGGNAVAAIDVLRNKAEAGQHVVIIGGGFTGVETALHLADQGKQVTLVERSDDWMKDDLITFKITYGGMLADKNITIHLQASVESIHEGGITFRQKDGTQRELLADTVIRAIGYSANLDLVQKLEDQVDAAVFSIGDCKQPGRIYDAVHAGFLTGLHI